MVSLFILNYLTHFCHHIGLYELWKTGRYKSYPPDMLVDLVARILALVPPWTRVYRVQRCVISCPFHCEPFLPF